MQNREFLRLAITAVEKMPIFGGKEGSRMLVLNADCKYM
jgi:hypothetical protein